MSNYTYLIYLFASAVADVQILCVQTRWLVQQQRGLCLLDDEA